MYHVFAAQLLCQAYGAGVQYPGHVLIHPAWYQERWWNDSNIDFNCSLEERESVLEHMLSIYQYEFIEDVDDKADNGVTGSEFLAAYNNTFDNEPLLRDLDVKHNNLAQTCYDGTWALAMALNRTIQAVGNNTDLNKRAQEEAMINASFGLENFTYNNTSVLEVLFGYLEKTQFRGITGDIMFDASGIRIGGRIQVFQTRYDQQGRLKPIKIADVRKSGSNASFEYINDESDETVWIDGIPYDGVPEEVVVTIHISSASIFITLATAGLIFTLICLTFNFLFRKKRLIQLSSPNLNYLIGVGAILLYFDAYLLVAPTTDKTATTVKCNVTPWLTSLGYSMCFGTIMAKMVRVFYIFSNPTLKKKTIKDWHLLVFIAVLVIVDLVILITYTIVISVNGELSASKNENVEHPSEEKGVFRKKYVYFIFVCTSDARRITLGILYGYKALLQILAVILALKTRKVQIKGLDDSKYIIAATYLSSLVLLAVIIMTYTASKLINTYAAVSSACFIIGSTMIVAIVFIPKMVILYEDPEGTTVFKTTDISATKKANNTEEEVTLAALNQKIEELEKKLTIQTKRTDTNSMMDTAEDNSKL